VISLADIKRGCFERGVLGVEKSWYRQARVTDPRQTGPAAYSVPYGRPRQCRVNKITQVSTL